MVFVEHQLTTRKRLSKMQIKIKIFSWALAITALSFVGCKKEAFVELNTNPDVLYTIKPEEQFFTAGRLTHGSDFEQFYDNFRRIMHWVQMSTAQGGNASATLTEVGNTNQRLSIFYPGVGSVTTDVGKLAEKMSESDKAARQMLVAMAEVMKIQYAFYVSDMNGHVAYTEAFNARYEGNFTPKWESQQDVFNLWEGRLKTLAATLKAGAANQVSLTNYDQYYGGNTTNWAKAANALRMRIAMRMLKRDATKATAILRDCIADPTLLMANNDESWVYTAHNSFTAGGNWNPEGFRAPQPTVNFMWTTTDPRIRLFYRMNNYTQANINTAIAAGVLAPGTTEPTRRYVGAPISPDIAQSPAYRTWFTGRRVNSSLTLDTISYMQERMWQPTYGGGTGRTFFNVITYADQLFMRAEMAARGISTENAESLYNQGITASINFYNTRAAAAAVTDYVAVTPAEITAYLNNATVKWDPAKGLEQIAIQSYINFYKQPNEAWALFKRTGMPNKNTALANEDILINGTVYAIPRRAVINNPSPSDLNAANKQAAINEMMKDPEFGNDPLNPYGRIWWDKQ
jgi:hypothetical protein